MKKVINILRSRFYCCCFIDKVSGRAVNKYKRKDGSFFMANSKIEALLFKVEVK